MITIMSATGNIGSKTAKQLLARGKQVRVIGRSRERLAEFQDLGAEIAVGDATDIRFLADAFSGSKALLTLIPPDYVAKSFGEHYRVISEAIVAALGVVKTQRIVNISSVGAELAAGTGPIKYLHAHEERMNKLGFGSITHLRPASFMENLLMQIPTLKSANLLAGATRGDLATPMIATADIADVAVEELTKPGKPGVTVRELLGPKNVSLNEAAEILSGVLKRPVKYLQVSYDDLKGALVQAGLSPDVAVQFAEMSEAANTGLITRPATRDALTGTPTELRDFAKVFASLA